MPNRPADDIPPRADPSIRFKAKRHNEQLKALYGFLNAIGAAVIITALIAPSILGTAIGSQLDQPGWVLIGLSLHGIGQAALRFGMRSED